MFKKIISLSLCLVFFALCGCSKADNTSSAVDSVPEVVVEEEKFAINPLTGVKNLDPAALNNRPVAIMVGNCTDGQKAQTGLNYADIIYETEVEDGITRLMAVYQDITKADKVGSVRSARYPYIDLAMGHNAVYIHCGEGNTATAHLKDLDHISIDTKSVGAKRIPNGLPSWHTLYALTGDLWNNINSKFDTKSTDTTPWLNFYDEDETVTLTAGSATSITVPFQANTTKFTYNAEKGVYTRLNKNGVAVADYNTKESTEIENVLVLLSKITIHSNGKHRMVEFTQGDGYYFTNGTYTFIKWSKGDAENSFKFTDTEGNKLKVKAGKSWICIGDKARSNPTIQ